MNEARPSGATTAATAGRTARSRQATGTTVTSTARITTTPALRLRPATQAHSAAVIHQRRARANRQPAAAVRKSPSV